MKTQLKQETFDPANLREYGLEYKTFDELNEMYKNGEIEMEIKENGRAYITKVY